MGFGGIIATGIMIIVLIVTGYLILASLDYSVDAASASLATVRDATDTRLRTSMSLEVGAPSASHVDCNVTNTGRTPIDNVTAMDVIVRTIAGGEVTGCTWLPYENATALDRDHWYVLEWPPVTREGLYGLGPGDTMVIRCVFGSADAGDSLVEVSAPNGVKAAGYYRAI
ncbi:MAG: hypothetical protein A4E28_01848 [Methanocella sp. PtaU1.Bin125]|nr:MAG: hypothetical protein A4E28_01848 [Methanocella sp. PtaU1.Bin125]